MKGGLGEEQQRTREGGVKVRVETHTNKDKESEQPADADLLQSLRQDFPGCTRAPCSCPHTQDNVKDSLWRGQQHLAAWWTPSALMEAGVDPERML
jgi:hypothetical protein